MLIQGTTPKTRCRSMSTEASLRRNTRSDGFTLIELMVVVMIIAVLIAIAIPSFLGFRGGAQDRAVQATLTTAEKVAHLVLIDEGTFPSKATLLVLLPTIETSIEWIDHVDSSTGPSQVSLDDDNAGQDLVLATLSESGACFYLRVINGSPPARKVVQAAATCASHDYQDGVDTGW